MPLFNQRWHFSKIHISQSPEDAGVYLLWERYEPTYVGVALGDPATIRSELARHLTSDKPPGKGATHFSFQLSANPKQLAEQQIEDHLDMFGEWPRHNRGDS
jgi:hypothetical protein